MYQPADAEPLTFEQRAKWFGRFWELMSAPRPVDPFTQEDADELDDHLAQAKARGRDHGR